MKIRSKIEEEQGLPSKEWEASAAFRTDQPTDRSCDNLDSGNSGKLFHAKNGCKDFSTNLGVLPEHFTIMSAALDAHCEERHQEMKSTLKKLGFSSIEVEGHYSRTEKSFIVPHFGTAEEHSSLEIIGCLFEQEAVLHRAGNHNVLVYLKYGDTTEGFGWEVNQAFEAQYTRYGDIKFRVSV